MNISERLGRPKPKVIDETVESMGKAHTSFAEANTMVEIMDRMLTANHFDTHGL